MKFLLATLAIAAAPLAAADQHRPPVPTDPAVPVPAMKYDSAFAGYRAYRGQSILPWRDVNDDVARAGGHAGIFRDHGTHAPAKPATPPTPGTAVKPDSTPSPEAAEKPAAQGHGSQQ